MKKLSDYKGQKIAVNCTTPEQAEAFCKLMHENGLVWRTKDSYLEKTYWRHYKENTCYDFNTGEFGDIEFYQCAVYTILPATDFLEEFVYGKEYEFSDYKDFKFKFIRVLIGKSPCEKYFITWNTTYGNSGYYKYCRKINTERNEAITKAKELITKFNIKQEEIY